MTSEVGSNVTALDRRKFVLGLGLAGMSGIAAARLPKPIFPRVTQKDFIKIIPKTIDDFAFDTESGLVLPPPDALSARLYDNTVTRTYTSARTGKTVMFLVAYNNKQDGVLQLHRPEICYPAGGFKLSTIEAVDVNVKPNAPLPGQAFLASSDERDEFVFYWTRVANNFPREWGDQRWAVAKENLRGIVPDGILARVSTIGNDPKDAMQTIDGFIRGLYRASGAQARQLLFGRL